MFLTNVLESALAAWQHELYEIGGFLVNFLQQQAIIHIVTLR